jgi:hypothetical protein
MAEHDEQLVMPLEPALERIDIGFESKCAMQVL